MKSRRWGKVLKRALVTSLAALKGAGLATPQAVITGTGLGCIENTEKMIDALIAEGEDASQPTHFMQSTHNTIGSLIAIYTHCHGYNATYSHNGISYDSALLDAFMQIQSGAIDNALVGCNDELTPAAYDLLKQAGLAGRQGQATMSEGSVAMVLSSNPAGALCEVESVDLYYDTPLAGKIGAPQLLLTGSNGIDSQYRFLQATGLPTRSYKRLFGESYAASGLGTMAAACMLQAGHCGNALIVNIDGHSASLIRLKR